jgi:hypothetical protein
MNMPFDTTWLEHQELIQRSRSLVVSAANRWLRNACHQKDNTSMARLGYSKAFAYVFFGFGYLALAISDERPENAIPSAQHRTTAEVDKTSDLLLFPLHGRIASLDIVRASQKGTSRFVLALPGRCPLAQKIPIRQKTSS